MLSIKAHSDNDKTADLKTKTPRTLS